MVDDRERHKEIAQLIQAYLDVHRRAADTGPGILQWWLGPEAADADLGKVEAALRDLVESGHVRASTLLDGRVVYQRAEPSPPQGGTGPPPPSRPRNRPT